MPIPDTMNNMDTNTTTHEGPCNVMVCGSPTARQCAEVAKAYADKINKESK